MYDDATKPYQPQKLRLAEFKAIYKQTKQLPFILRYLILGLLIWIEDKYIGYKIDTTITQAIDEYNATVVDQKPQPTITITENPNSSHQLPTLTISAPHSKGFPSNE